MKVWIVSEVYFEGTIIKHVCLSKETALKHWATIREMMINENWDMVEFNKRDGYDSSTWESYMQSLLILEPGESPNERCDYPGLEEWECEE